MEVVTGRPVQVLDTLDDRQGLSGQRQDMSAAIIRIRYALDEPGRLQSIKQANERNWPDVENLSEGSLVEPFVLRQLYEDTASSESHTWELGAQRAVVEIASQPGCIEQQPHNRIRIIRPGIILGPRGRLRGRGLLQQPTDGRFVRPIRCGRLRFHADGILLRGGRPFLGYGGRLGVAFELLRRRLSRYALRDWRRYRFCWRQTQFCGDGHGTSFSIPNPHRSNCGQLAKMKMPSVLHLVLSWIHRLIRLRVSSMQEIEISMPESLGFAVLANPEWNFWAICERQRPLGPADHCLAVGRRGLRPQPSGDTEAGMLEGRLSSHPPSRFEE
jgi:hypothetical protein